MENLYRFLAASELSILLSVSHPRRDAINMLYIPALNAIEQMKEAASEENVERFVVEKASAAFSLLFFGSTFLDFYYKDSVSEAYQKFKSCVNYVSETYASFRHKNIDS